MSSSYVVLKKGRSSSIDVGSLQDVFPYDSSYDVKDLNNIGTLDIIIDALEKDLIKFEGEIKALVAYSPKSKEDLFKVQEDTESCLDCIKERSESIKLIYLMKRAIEDEGFKVVIN